jgi:sugar phosphate isomerase/epimerase
VSTTAAYLSLAGASHGHPARWPVLERAKAAHAVGIEAIGVRTDEVMDPEVLRYVAVPEIEWVDLNQPITPRQALAIRLLVADYGATRLNVGLCDDNTLWWLAARNLETVLAATEDLNLTVAVEPVVFGSVSSLADVQKVITQAGAAGDPRVGVLYDLCQVQLGTPYREGLGGADKPPADVVEIQVCGIGYSEPGRPALELTQDRAPIAESVVDVASWLRSLRKAGVTAPVSYENPNAAWRSLDLLPLAEKVAADMEAVS